MDDEEPAVKVEVRGLEFGYLAKNASHLVLSDLDLDVESGSVHAVVGISGCGKSTLLRLIGGLEQPSAGIIRFIGTPRYRHRTSMVFQEPRLLPWWTAERNVGIGTEFTEMPRGRFQLLKDFYLSHVGLGGMKDRLPNTLSGGQQSRVGLGRALAHDADVLLMDEPFAHLDAMSRREMHKRLESVFEGDPRTTLLVTHDVEEAVILADRVSVMRSEPGPLVETIEVDAERPRLN
ncbi:MAG: ATP-binding cassette domain-containing protein, partial [Acidimicrobiia bacterium]|nr:ATP-binding cassette domain-containing protein [Acidimicrobiia bacterium]